MEHSNFKEIPRYPRYGIQMRPLFLYLALLAIFSVAMYAALTSFKMSGASIKILSIIYMWTPTLATVIVLRSGKAILDVLGEFRLKWYLIAGLVPLIHLALVRLILSSQWIDPSLVLFLLKGINVSTTKLLVEGLVAGYTVNAVVALGEEIGWRGFMFKVLRGNRLTKSIVIGTVWALWHWPLIVLGYLNFPQSKALGIPIFALTLIPMTYVMLFFREREGVYSTAVLHGVTNGVLGMEYLALSQLPDWLRPPSGLWGALAWIIIATAITAIEKMISRSSSLALPVRSER
ncbi:hypothetical protein IPA_05410 [Ignicoccus pacificus DSM 13166]|uniref:CAAX prenyl protease 2/Lysostaphin resistance protein A-like domain-containing protein n=1 Tax=Ignicoccus pacificus DSM 13166 TaxID=940294 RepID=A0A977PKY0_9CREN|nr:hypothetical protein IPA_05410 [Ignicoccus pacificus DSM 13166]